MRGVRWIYQLMVPKINLMLTPFFYFKISVGAYYDP